MVADTRKLCTVTTISPLNDVEMYNERNSLIEYYFKGDEYPLEIWLSIDSLTLCKSYGIWCAIFRSLYIILLTIFRLMCCFTFH